jgi:general stress protein 26
MSSGFSNADTGSKNADPYTQKNLEDPALKEKAEDLLNFVDKTKFCLLTTQVADSDLLASRAMALAAKVSYTLSSLNLLLKAMQEGHGFDFLFHTNTESGKTDDLQEHKSVNIGFINNAGEWASISGHASIETDREVVRKHYSPALKAWIGDLGDGKHDGGPEDPRIGIIRVKASTAQYAVSKKTQIGGFVELAKGIATGDSPSVNKLRHLSEQEIQQYRSS